ncbi:hypothetical protein BKA70DRAFT_1416013 [Coprinopsis sp. MPI-PUGE-AT-0042]|nr:hypothetical protein BKA70DRAFT_1416013 [Coprinopsis sp. MPI-PUGE-AT-0042]
MTITQSQDAPLVVVGGATGNQGGGVIRFLVESPKAHRIHALTRDVTKPSARKLADQGIEVVSVNLTSNNKAKAVEAYTGADVVFSVTNFWEHMDPQREEDEGKAMINVAIEAGVKLFIFSALPSVRKQSKGKYSHVRAIIEDKAVQDDSRPVLTVGEWVSMDQIVKTIEKKSGTPVKYEEVDGEVYKQTLPDVIPGHVKTNLAEFWAAMGEFGYYGGGDTDWILPYLGQRPATFSEWATTADFSQYTD